jgi:predicted nucleic acid-binding protein
VTRFLVDNSVWQRLPRSVVVREAINALLDAEDELRCCALSLDEFAYSARSAAFSQRSGPDGWFRAVRSIEPVPHDVWQKGFGTGQRRTVV